MVGTTYPVKPPNRSDAVAARFPKRGKLMQNEPTIGVVLSGGGWRAMESGAYFMDVLREAGLLPLTNVVAGLSGGSWTCVLGAVTGDANRLYHKIDPNSTEEESNAWVEGGKALTLNMLSRLEEFMSKDNAIAARKESLAHGGRRRDTLKDGMVTAVRLVDSHLGDLADALSLNADESYLYNYSSTLGYQFFGESFKDVPLTQSTTTGLPLVVVAAIGPGPKDSRVDYDQHYWYEIDGFQVGGIHQLPFRDFEKKIQPRYELDGMTLRFSNFDKHNDPFRASHVMAMCGCALEDNQRNLIKAMGSFIDKDGFSAHAYHSDDGKKEYANLFDAGAACNIPLKLARGRCNVAFVVDASAGEVAAEEVAISVEKEYYHIYYPPGPARETFIKDHVTAKWEVGNDIRIFFPDRYHSKALWGETSAECDHDEPILIFMRALRTESTFRMDRTRAEIDAAYATMAEIGRKAVIALEFVMKQDEVPKKAFWDMNDILGTEEALKLANSVPPPPSASLTGVHCAGQHDFVAKKLGVTEEAPLPTVTLTSTHHVEDDLNIVTSVRSSRMMQSVHHDHREKITFRGVAQPLVVETHEDTTMEEEVYEDQIATRETIVQCRREIDEDREHLTMFQQRSDLEVSTRIDRIADRRSELEEVTYKSQATKDMLERTMAERRELEQAVAQAERNMQSIPVTMSGGDDGDASTDGESEMTRRIEDCQIAHENLEEFLERIVALEREHNEHNSMRAQLEQELVEERQRIDRLRRDDEERSHMLASQLEEKVAHMDRLIATRMASIQQRTYVESDVDSPTTVTITSTAHDPLTLVSRHHSEVDTFTTKTTPVLAWTALPNVYMMEMAIERAYINTLAVPKTPADLRREALKLLEGANIPFTVGRATTRAITTELVYQAFAWAIKAGEVLEKSDETAELAASLSGRARLEIASAMLTADVCWPSSATNLANFFNVVAALIPYLPITTSAKQLMAEIILGRLDLETKSTETAADGNNKMTPEEAELLVSLRDIVDHPDKLPITKREH